MKNFRIFILLTVFTILGFNQRLSAECQNNQTEDNTTSSSGKTKVANRKEDLISLRHLKETDSILKNMTGTQAGIRMIRKKIMQEGETGSRDTGQASNLVLITIRHLKTILVYLPKLTI